MTVAIDNTTVDSSIVSGATSFNHVSSGVERGLKVDVSVFDNVGVVTINSMTYAGVPMIPEASIANGNLITFTYRLENQASGSNAVAVNISGNGSILVVATSYTGVDQDDMMRGSATATGSSVTPSVVVTSEVGDVVNSVVGMQGLQTFTPGAGQAELSDQQAASSGENESQTSSDEPGAASVTMDYTASGSQNWTTVGASIQPPVVGVFKPLTSVL